MKRLFTAALIGIGMGLSLLLLSSSAPAWADQTVNIPQLQQANALMAQGRYADAISCWADLLKASPDLPESAEWQYYLGVCLATTPRIPEAIAALEAIQSRSPYYGDALVQLFTIHLKNGDEEHAEAVRQRCYAAWPQSEYVQRILEADFSLRPPQDQQKACQAFRQAEKLNVLPEEGYRILHGLYYDALLAEYTKAPLQHIPDALALLDDVEANQRTVNEHVKRHDLTFKQCMYRLDLNSGVVYQVLLPLTPDSPGIRQVLDKARPVLEMIGQCDKMAPANILGALNALISCRAKDVQPAGWIPGYSRLLLKLPPTEAKRPAYLQAYGQWVHGLARSEAFYERPFQELESEAEAAYRLLLTDHPEAPEVKLALHGLYEIYRRAGREKDLAELLAAIAKSKSPVMMEWQAEYAYALGTREGYEQAMTVLAQLTKQINTHPMRPTWLYRLGRCYEYLGKPAEAIIAYQQVIDGYPKTSCAVAANWAIAALKGAR